MEVAASYGKCSEGNNFKLNGSRLRTKLKIHKQLFEKPGASATQTRIGL